MKIVVIGDSHGNIANLKLVAGFAKKIKADGLIHCGDWDNLQAVKIIYSCKIPIYGVLGNADIDPKMAKIVNGQWLKIDLENFLWS
ncbi:MAG: metallophosphoesterase family protein [Candidatus Woesebacteria bacterium]|nr:metallophosphoesterase family protein [Candidatus Woesebacteria bacterium]